MQVRIVPVKLGRGERVNDPQVWSPVRSKNPGVGSGKLNQVELTISSEVEELLASAIRGERGFSATVSDGRSARRFSIPISSVRFRPGSACRTRRRPAPSGAGSPSPSRSTHCSCRRPGRTGRFSRLRLELVDVFVDRSVGLYSNSTGGNDLLSR